MLAGPGEEAGDDEVRWGVVLDQATVSQLPDLAAEALDQPAVVGDGEDRAGEVGQGALERLEQVGTLAMLTTRGARQRRARRTAPTGIAESTTNAQNSGS